MTYQRVSIIRLNRMIAEMLPRDVKAGPTYPKRRQEYLEKFERLLARFAISKSAIYSIAHGRSTKYEGGLVLYLKVVDEEKWTVRKYTVPHDLNTDNVIIGKDEPAGPEFENPLSLNAPGGRIEYHDRPLRALKDPFRRFHGKRRE